MEGIGSRLGRVSSRYGSGPAPTPPVFSGPVRKWKREWVPSSEPTTHKGKKQRVQHHQQNTPPLLLRRWTPLSSTDSGDSPKRKIRYTPVIVLEEKKKEAMEKVVDKEKASTAKQSAVSMTVRSNSPFKKPHLSDFFLEEMKELSKEQASFSEGNLDLQLYFESA